MHECFKNEELLAYWEKKTEALPPESDLKKNMSEKINMVKIDKFLNDLDKTSTEIDSTHIEKMCSQSTFLYGYFTRRISHFIFEQEKKGVIDEILKRNSQLRNE